MAIRDDLIPILDDIRRDVIDTAVGLRLDDVVIRRRSWSGRAPGQGTYTDLDTALDPRPKVYDPSPRWKMAEPGRFEEGDQVVDKISLTYTKEELEGGELPPATELYWLINDQAFRVISVEERFHAWRVHLRKMRERL